MRSLAYLQNTSLGSAVSIAKGLNNVATAAVANGGSGYRQNDLVDVTGSGTAVIKCTVRVLTVDSAGAVLACEIAYKGVYTSNPDATAATTARTGSGSGLTLDLTFNADVVPEGATFATVGAEAQDLRWRDDGTDPTGSVGNVIKVGTPMTFKSRLDLVKIIEDAGGGIANINFYRQ